MILYDPEPGSKESGMTPKTTIPAITTNGLASRRRNIVSMAALSLLMMCLLPGFALAADTDNGSQMDSADGIFHHYHYVMCVVPDGSLPFYPHGPSVKITVDCPYPGRHGYSWKKDLQECRSALGPDAQLGGLAGNWCTSQ